MTVRFVLEHAPYDTFDFAVIDPFTYRLTLAEVRGKEPPPLALLYALGLALLSLLWHRRGHPKLPSDLAFALAPEGAAAKLSPRTLGAGSLLARVLGLAVEKPVIAESGDEPLAWVRPVDGELYQLRLGKGVTLEARDSGPPPVRSGNLATVAAHRIYCLRRKDKAYRIRLEYRA